MFLTTALVAKAKLPMTHTVVSGPILLVGILGGAFEIPEASTSVPGILISICLQGIRPLERQNLPDVSVQSKGSPTLPCMRSP